MLGRELINDTSVVCDMRTTHNLPCKDCIYKGRICEAVKHRFKVKKPYELINKE